MKITLKQDIYGHGGSRIFMSDEEDRQRNLLCDTYGDKEFAVAMKESVAKYIEEHGVPDEN